MHQTGFFHHIGTFLLFCAMVLLVITSISAPVVHDISMLKINLVGGGNSPNEGITLGTFGYCFIGQPSGGDQCSSSQIGYDPAQIVSSVDSDVSFSSYSADTSKGLTRVMILHPIAAGISFFAFLTGLGAGIVGSLFAALLAFITFIVTLVVLITDFICFAIIRNAVNNANDGNWAEYGAASWTLLVSAICSFFGMIIIFFTCCSARLHRRRQVPKGDHWDGPATAPPRRRWF